VAQDDYYYEIQLTNKQLVFYFMAGAVGLILSFLAGVMVGRGVDAAAGDVQAARPPGLERMVTDEPPRPAASTEPAAEELTYAQRLEGERADDSLEGGRKEAPQDKTLAAALAQDPSVKKLAPPAPKQPAPRPSPAAATSQPVASPTATPEAPGLEPRARAKPEPAPKATARPATPKALAPAPGSFSIQVGAFKDKTTAESVAGRLKAKGYAAYLVSPEGGGLYNVRVGSYPARDDAERVLRKLRDEEKFKPFIVKP
jgi:DedD protein